MQSSTKRGANKKKNSDLINLEEDSETQRPHQEAHAENATFEMPTEKHPSDEEAIEVILPADQVKQESPQKSDDFSFQMKPNNKDQVHAAQQEQASQSYGDEDESDKEKAGNNKGIPEAGTTNNLGSHGEVDEGEIRECMQTPPKQAPAQSDNKQNNLQS